MTDERFDRETAKSVKVGDVVELAPLWNQSNGRPSNKLNPPIKVIVIEEGEGCQTGRMFSVLDRDRKHLKLDAGWFVRPKALSSA